jgi:hypothetical protein
MEAVVAVNCTGTGALSCDGSSSCEQAANSIVTKAMQPAFLKNFENLMFYLFLLLLFLFVLKSESRSRPALRAATPDGVKQ